MREHMKFCTITLPSVMNTTVRHHLLHIVLGPIEVMQEVRYIILRNVTRVSRVQCVATSYRLLFEFWPRRARFTLHCQSTWNKPNENRCSNQIKKFVGNFRVCNKWGCIHPLNFIIFRTERSRWMDVVCNKWGFAISEVCNMWGFTVV